MRLKARQNEWELCYEFAALDAVDTVETEAVTRIRIRPGLCEDVRLPRLIMGKW